MVSASINAMTLDFDMLNWCITWSKRLNPFWHGHRIWQANEPMTLTRLFFYLLLFIFNASQSYALNACVLSIFLFVLFFCLEMSHNELCQLWFYFSSDFYNAMENQLEGNGRQMTINTHSIAKSITKTNFYYWHSEMWIRSHKSKQNDCNYNYEK